MSLVQPATLSDQEKIINIMVRVFHWSVVLLFIILFVTGDNNNGGDAPHIVLGYLLISFILARMLWGVMGNVSARWKNYLYHPKQVVLYLSQLFGANTMPDFKLHNPAGSSMILIIMSLLSMVAITGLLLESLFEFSGMLLFLTAYFSSHTASLVKEMHGVLAHLMLLAIALHLLGVLYSSYKYRVNMPLMIITGRLHFIKNKGKI